MQKARKRKVAESLDDDDDEVSEEEVKSQKKGKKKEATVTDKQTTTRPHFEGFFFFFNLFILNKNSELNVCKREDIRKNVLKDHKNVGRSVIKLAQKKLMNIFGFELFEVNKKKKQDEGGSGIFVLRNALKVSDEFMNWSEQEANEMALLMVILSMIYINNHEIDQDTLYAQLKRLGLREGENNHPVFGDWESLITKKFVKQMYLSKKKGDKMSRHDTKMFTFKMGPRAHAEIDKRDILKFISFIYGEESVDPHMLRALELEEEDSDDSSSEEEEDNATQHSQSQAQSQSRDSSYAVRRRSRY